MKEVVCFCPRNAVSGLLP